MSNLLDRSSLVLTPTAYNNGEALCIKPDDGSGDFDFSRNSAATRVNAQGLVENVQILSSNLVQNGDFSEEGVQEVSNGSFSQEGVEEVTNGSFDTDSDWNKGAGWSISGGKAICDGTNSVYLYQSLAGTTTNEVFKITYTISNYISGSVAVGFGSGLNQPLGTQRNANGTYTEYLTKSSTSTSFGFKSASFIGSIDNVSVREVGQDWDLSSSNISIGEDKLVCNNVLENNAIATQVNVIPVQKQVKVQFHIVVNSGSFRMLVGSGGTSTIVTTSGTYTFYETSGTGGNLNLQARAGGFDGSITNISVKEVGQNWTLGTGWSIGSSELIATSVSNQFVTQSFAFTSGKRYRASFSVTGTSSLPNNASLRLPYDGNVSNIAYVNQNSDGVYSHEFVSNGSSILYLGFGSFTGTITNISVIEISSDTNLPRINYENFSYQDALGSELILNGDFSNGFTNWSTYGNTSVSNGVATIGANANSGIYQSILSQNKSYKVTINVTAYNGVGQAQIANDTGFVLYSINGVGEQSFIFKHTIPQLNLIIRGLSNALFSIDNVSVKEYLGQEVVPDSGCGSWLFEPQSTNLRELSNTYVGDATIRGTISNDASAVSPSGLLGVEYLTATGTNGLVLDSSTLTGDGTFSVYLKRKTGVGDIRMSINGGVSNTTMAVTDVWKRFSLSSTTGLGQLVISCLISGDEVYIWGWQEEALSYPTSLIPTDGSQTTRNQDVCNNGGSLATINSTEGVLYAEIKLGQAYSSSRYIGLSNGGTSNRVIFGVPGNATSTITWFIGSGGQVNGSATGVDFSIFNKIALKYSENNVALWINGVKVNTNLSVSMPTGLNTLEFNQGGSGNLFYGKTKAVAVWKEALSDSELQSLTTI